MRVARNLNIVLDPTIGHTDSHDCWCEPSSIWLGCISGLPGITRVIEHNDDTKECHYLITNQRDRDHTLATTDAWVTRILMSLGD